MKNVLILMGVIGLALCGCQSATRNANLAIEATLKTYETALNASDTHAAQLRVEGVDIAIISRQLGHASITTTACYLDHLAPRAVIETMRNRKWSGA